MSFFAGRVILILIVIIKDIALLYLKHLWVLAGTRLFLWWSISQMQLSRNQSDHALNKRVNVLEQKLQDQETEMKLWMGQAWELRKNTRESVDDMKNKLEMAVWKVDEGGVDQRARSPKNVEDLSANKLTELTPQIGLIQTLQEIHFSFNSITELPADLGRCVNLQKIEATNNSIQSLPPELGRLTKLKHFDLTSNKLTVVPPEIGQIPVLEKIDLSLNPVIGAIDAQARKGVDALVRFLRSEEYEEIYYRETKKERPTNTTSVSP